ncbi:unnamed protein product, partial [Mesorhabditis spiculigera]
MFGFAAIPAGIQFVVFFCMPESPRWLYEHGRIEDAKSVLDKIYNGDKAWIEYEVAELTLAAERGRTVPQETGMALLWRIFTTAHVRKALLVGCVLQGFQQLSGINTIMYYTGKIIQSAGVSSKHATIWISAAISAVNFLCTFLPLYMVDRCGRRVLLIASVLGVGATLLAMGGAFLAINRESDLVINNYTASPVNHIAHCKAYSNCDYCVTDERCGFCKAKAADAGYCVPFSMDTDDRSLTGPCINGTEHGRGQAYQWSPSFCRSGLTMLPIGLMILYLGFFSIGFAPLPWVLNAEFYPLWARSTCVAMATAANWAFNLLISLTFLSLSQALTKYGTFWLYGGVTAIALIFVVIAVPETKNCSIEEVERLFMSEEERLKQNRSIGYQKRSQSVDVVF